MAELVKTRTRKKRIELSDDDALSAVSTGSVKSQFSGHGENHDIYLVERIVGKRTNPENGNLEYRIKWRNYPSSANTWEPKENILYEGLITKYETLELEKAQKKIEQKKQQIEEMRKGKLRLLEKGKNGATRAVRGGKVGKVKRMQIIYPSSESDDSDLPLQVSKSAEPSVTATTGFEMGYKTEKIIGARNDGSSDNPKISYLVKFKGVPTPELIPSDICREMCPQHIISHMQLCAIWDPESYESE